MNADIGNDLTHYFTLIIMIVRIIVMIVSDDLIKDE